MAPVVKRPTSGLIPGQSERNETESGSQVLNRDAEAPPAIGKVEVFLVLKIC